jgi:hypothetical protein
MATPVSPISPDLLSALYEQDYCAWLEAVIDKLRENKFLEVDLPHLLEELEDMGRSEKRALTSNLIVLLIHLLKYQAQPNKRSNSWRFTIKEHRRRIREALKASPSLNRYLEAIWEESYQEARDLAATETGLPLETFPPIPLFTVTEILDARYLPENEG